MLLVAGVLPAVCLSARAQQEALTETAATSSSADVRTVADTPFAVSILRDRALYNDQALYEWPDEFRQTSAGQPSKWASFDKLQHVTFSFLMTIGAQYTLVDKFDVSSASAIPVSAGSSLAVGVAKELYDRQRTDGGRFDIRDLVADLVGVTLGVALILI